MNTVENCLGTKVIRGQRASMQSYKHEDNKDRALLQVGYHGQESTAAIGTRTCQHDILPQPDYCHLRQQTKI